MRLEHIPLIIGAIVALIGLGFIADGLMADSGRPGTERRRRMRAERSRAGETIVGLGTLGLAAALIGRDTWRYGTVAVLVGGVMILIGVVLNRAFLKEALLFRGPARRADPADAASGAVGARQRPSPAKRHHPPPPSTPPVAASATTPAPPMRAASPPPAPAASSPTRPVERRKTPRGKK
jgi:hypothetical protein